MKISVTDSARNELNVIMGSSSFKTPAVRIQISGMG